MSNNFLLLDLPGNLFGFSKPRYFQRLGHFAPLSFTAFGGKIHGTRCAGGR